MISPRKTVANETAYKAPLEGRVGMTRLDFNEHTEGYPELESESSEASVATYPEYEPLIAGLSEYWQVEPNQIAVTNGSDEALFVVAFTFIEPGQDHAVVAKPTFPIIPHYLRLVGAELTEVSVTDDFKFDLGSMRAAIERGAKICVIASPDNPTGAVIELEQLERLVGSFPHVLFVLDEAYSEYAGISAVGMVSRFENLLVVKTFSKAWAMAGLRLGAIIGSAQMIDVIKKVRAPYAVNSLAAQTALKALKIVDKIKEYALHTMERKQQVINVLEERGWKVSAGRGNFFLLYLGEAHASFCRFMRHRNILVRDRSDIFKLNGWVRVSVGSQVEMEAFEQATKEFRAQQDSVEDKV